MSSIDNRVVRMVFDNSRFKAEAAKTKQSLDSVDQAITKAGRNTGLLNLGNNMKDLVSKSGAMKVAVVTAIGTISNKLTNLGINAAKSLTLDPIKQGFQEYGELLTKQNTIQNATGKSAKQVKGVLNDLNTYSDKTIFSFGDMTQALTTFVNAGVPLKKASKSIQGIANASAFAGASAQESQSSFLAFSQSLSAGFLGLQDWRQAAVTGKIGTVGFKNELLKAAAAQGILTKKGDEYVTKKGTRISATKGFDQSLRQQWASANVLNEALGKFTDTSTKLGQDATKAATKVRTLSAFTNTLKESIGSGWAQVFGAMFGGLEDATNMWTTLSVSIGNVVSAFFKFVTTMIQQWRDLGGAIKLAQAFKNVLSPFGALFKAIGDAWRAAFPKSGNGLGSTLYGITVALELITRPLTWLAKLISLLVHPLTIFFLILKIGGEGVGEVLGFISDFVKHLLGLASLKMPSAGGSDSLLGWIKAVASEVERALHVVGSLLDEGKSLKDAFGALGHIDFKLPKLPGVSLPSFGGLFGNKSDTKQAQTLNAQVVAFATNVQNLDFHDGVANIKQLTGDMDGMSTTFHDGVQNIKELTGEMDSSFTPSMGKAADAGSGFLGFIKKIAGGIADFFQKIKGKDIAASLNFAVLATMGVSLARFLNNLSKFGKGFNDLIKTISKTFTSLGKAMDEWGKSKKRESQANLIKTVALSLLILSVALLILSRIPQDKLITAFEGLAGAVLAMSIVMFVMSKAIKALPEKSSGKMLALGVSMVGIGLGLLFLAGAMKIMSTVGLDTVVQTLATLAVLFKGLQVIGNTAEKSGRTMFAAAASMVVIAAAIGALAVAMLLFKLVDPKDMAKAGLSFGVMTVALLLLSAVPAKTLAATALVFVAIATAMSMLVATLLVFALVKWESIGKAAVVLTILTLAIIAINKVGGGAGGALGMVALGAAFVAIAFGCLMLNKVNWSSIGKAAAVLGILVLAFALFMVVVAAAEAVGAIESLTALAFGIAAMAAAIALLVTALALILPILALGVGAFAAFATGAAVAIAVFLQTLALEAGTMKDSIILIIKAFFDGIVEAIPVIINGIKRVIAAVWNALVSRDTTSKIGSGSKSIMQAIGDKIEEWAPKIGHILVKLIDGLLKVLQENSDNFGAAAVSLVTSLIAGMASRADKLAEAAIDLVIQLAIGIGKGLGKMVDAGIQLIIDFINSVANSIRSKAGAMGDAIQNLIDAFGDLGRQIMEGLAKGIIGNILAPVEAVGNVAKGMISKAGHILHIKSPSRVFMDIGKFLVMGLTKGIEDHSVSAITAVASLVGGQIAVASQYISKFVQDLDQQAIAARSKADALAAAAEKASAAAEKSKSKLDDASAEKLDAQAKAADAKATKAEDKAQKAKDASDRKDEFNQASTLDKAKMRSEDAQNQLDQAKQAEAAAAKDVAEAKALEKQANSGKFSKSEADKLRKEAADLRKDAKEQATLSNKLIQDAKQSAASALTLQKQAGAEAAAEFQKEFDQAAQDAADSDAFDALSDTDKAIKRRADAAALQAQANKDLVAAKKLAFTDVEAANELAQKSLDEADQARQYLHDAQGYEDAAAQAAAQAAQDAKDAADKGTDPTSSTGSIPITGTTVIDLTASDAAAAAYQSYSDQYTNAQAAAAAPQNVEFNQYNTSPESLSPTEIYRQTNNLLTHAADQLATAA